MIDASSSRPVSISTGSDSKPGMRAQRAAGLEAVEAGHQGVEHDHVGGPAAQDLERLFAAGRLGDREAALAQRDRGQQQVDFVVVDQQHLGLLGQHHVGRRAGRVHACAPSRASISASTSATWADRVSSRGSRPSESVAVRTRDSTSAQVADSAIAPMLADDDLRVWAT